MGQAASDDSTRLSEAAQTTADAWMEAVEMCKRASAVRTAGAVDSHNAFLAVERHLWTAEQAQATEDAMRRGCSKTEMMEMTSFRELLREVALVACEVYRCPEEQELIDKFNEAEARARAAAELRRSLGKRTTAYNAS